AGRAGEGERGIGATGLRGEPEGASGEHGRADQRRAGGAGMKARPVKKLDPSRPLGENAARIVQVRLDEMLAFAPTALDGKTKAQHDMRIAAKRLRYVLE